MSEDRVRVLRVLEYEGPREWVEYTLAKRSVKGETRVGGFNGEYGIIREAIMGEVPAVLGTEPREEPTYNVPHVALKDHPTPGTAVPKPKTCKLTKRCDWPKCATSIGKCSYMERHIDLGHFTDVDRRIKCTYPMCNARLKHCSKCWRWWPTGKLGVSTKPEEPAYNVAEARDRLTLLAKALENHREPVHSDGQWRHAGEAVRKIITDTLS